MSDIIDLTPLRGVRVTPRLNARFAEKIDRSGECWIWIGLRDGAGYGLFTLTVTSPRGLAQRTERVHRIVYEAIHGRIPRGMRVLHGCDCPPCLRPDHLRAGTDRDNWRDRLSRGRLRIPEGAAALPTRKSFAGWSRQMKISNADVAALRETYASDPDSTVVDLARRYSISPGFVRLILLGKTRKKAPGPLVGRIRKVRSPNAKLTPSKVIELRRRYQAGGETIYTLAPNYGVSPQIISQALRRETWADLDDGVPAFRRLRYARRRWARKLSPNDVEAIKVRVAQGVSKSQLAEEYRVSRGLIYDVLKPHAPTPPPTPPPVC